MRSRRERICAFLLALLLPIGSVLPHMTLAAAEVGSTITFNVSETLNAGTDDEATLPLAGAAVQIKNSGTDDVVAEGTTDQHGTANVSLVPDTTGSYEYVVVKRGYEDVSAPLGNSDPVNIEMEMKDIEVSETSFTLNLTKNQTETIMITNQIENKNDEGEDISGEPGYKWETSDPAVVKVGNNGIITPKKRGVADITVSRNGKSKKIPVTVKEELTDMAISVTPESTEDVDFVEISVTGMAEAKKPIAIYIGDSHLGNIEYSEETGYETFKYTDSDALKGKITFKAIYPEDDSDYYYRKEVSTKEITYKKNCSLKLIESSGNVTYGYTAPTIEIEDSSNQDRTLSYTSSNEKVAAVDPVTGKITIVGQGETTITVAAAASENYTKAEANYVLTVNKRPITVSLEQISWQPVQKIYDGTDTLQLIGTVQNNNDLVLGDTIQIPVMVQVDDKNEGNYTSAAITQVNKEDYSKIDTNANYEISLENDIVEGVELSDLNITIHQRPLYIKVQQKNAESDVTVQYGKIAADGTGVTDAFEVVTTEGVISGEENIVNDMLSRCTEIVLDALTPSSYVGTYPGAVKPQLVENADTGNYAVLFDETDINNYGSVTVVEEVTTDEELWKKVSVTKEDGTSLYSDGASYWVKDNDRIIFKTIETESGYNKVCVLDGNKPYQNGLTISSNNGETEVTNAFYLKNDNDTVEPYTRTISSESEISKDNQIPVGKIKIDSTIPVVKFSNLGMDGWGAFVSDEYTFGDFVQFLNAEYVETITVSDDESGYTPASQQYCLFALSADKDASNEIIEAVRGGTIEWQPLPEDGKITVPVAEEGYYAVLVKAEDNVGNQAVYASNGVVIDLEMPKVELELKSSMTEYGRFSGDVEYQITVTDPTEKAVSGISKLQVEVQVPDSSAENGYGTVAGNLGEYTNSYTLDNDALNILAELDGNKTEYTFEDLKAKSVYLINGKILASDCKSNQVKLNVTAYDQAGNQIKSEEHSLMMDSVQPAIELRYDVSEADNCYQKRIMEIQYTERDFDTSLASFAIKENGGSEESFTLQDLLDGEKGGITARLISDSQENVGEEDYTDDRVVIYQIQFGPQEGKDIDYVITPSITDKAGLSNDPVEPQEFTIDNSVPTVSVSYDNNEVKNDTYFKATRTMTVNFTERNYEADLAVLEIKVNGEVEKRSMSEWAGYEEKENAIKVSEGSVSGDTHTYEITFGAENKDIDYTVIPYITDKAGNTNLDENGTAIVEYDENVKAAQEFTVDMVAPVLNVTYETENPKEDITKDIGEQVQDSMYKNSPISATVQITERNFETNENGFTVMTLTETANKAASDGEGAEIAEAKTTHSSDIQDGMKWGTASTSGTDGHSIVLDYAVDANYSLALEYEDLAGNPVTYAAHYFTVDTTAPVAEMTIKEKTFSRLLSILTFGFFEKKSDGKYIQTTVSDPISPVKISYYKYEPGVNARGEFEGLSEEEVKGIDTWEDSWTALGDYEVVHPETKTYEYGITNPEQIVVYEKIEDKAGNITYINADGIICESQISDISVEVATAAPDTSFEVEEEKIVYDSDVDIVISVTDTDKEVYSGLKEVSYEIRNNGKVTQSGNYNDELADAAARVESISKKVTIDSALNNGNYIQIYVKAVDNSGNEAEYTKDIKIDITDPKIDVKYDLNSESVQNDKYFNADRTMTIVYTERNINPEGFTFDFAVGGQEPEVITLAELKENASDSGIEIVSETDSQSGIEDAGYYTDDRTYTVVLKLTGGPAQDQDYYIVPHIEDQAGRKADADYEDGTVAKDAFTIDKVQPTMEVKYYLADEEGSLGEEIPVGTDELGRLYKNQTVRAIVAINERNFGYESVFVDGQVQPVFTWTEDDGTAGSVEAYAESAQSRTKWDTDAEDAAIHTQAFDFIADGDYSFTMKYTDLAGNPLKTAYDTHYVTIDKTAPEVEVIYKADGKVLSETDVEKIAEAWKDGEEWLYRNETITAEIVITERNFGRKSDAEEAFEDGQMSLAYTAKDLAGTTVETEDYSKNADDRNEWIDGDGGHVPQYTRTQIFTFEKDANYEMSLAYQDLAGNTCGIDTQKFTVDKTAPEGTITIPDSGEWVSGEDTEKDSIWAKLLDVLYDFFVKDDQTTTMESSDVTSGVRGTYYYIDETATGKKTVSYLTVEDLEEKEWTAYTGKITVSPDSQSAIYEKVVDMAGNITYLNAERGIIADRTEPTLELKDISPVRNGIHYEKNQSVKVAVTVTDPKTNGVYSGIDRVEYTINSTTNQISSESGTVAMTYTESEDERSRVGTGTIAVNPSTFNSNDVTVTATVYDKAGNSTKKEIKLKIDITEPVVEAIVWNTNAASNGKYYNVTRTATITVRERNFDPNQVRLNITNTDGTMPQISGWTVGTGVTDDNKSTCTITFAADGDYTMSMNCTDRGGNVSNTVTEEEFTIDKTVPTISVSFDNNSAANGKYYNAARTATITVNEHNFNGSEVRTAISSNSVTPAVNSWSGGGDVHTATAGFTTDGNYSFTVNYTDLAGNAAEVYTVDEFVIDLTKPEIEIFDIEDKSANNGEVAPGVRYSDTNYDVNGVSITYSGTKHEVQAVDGARSSIPNGESIKMADFDHTEAMDDVYTMTAKVTDLAGNYDEKQVTFSVNRFGSNFIFSDDTEAFLNAYYNNEEENLVVTEINVDTLTHRGITCGHDGEMTDFTEGTDYTVRESGTEVSWKSYEYTISKENFEKEGMYNITIDSVDRATNEVNNKIKNANIEFVIDKTAPTVVITGVEDSGQYRTNERDITITTTDNVAMDRVELYVDDAAKPAESYNANTIQRQNGELPYTLTSSSNWQEVKAVAVDMAGNITDTSRPEGSEDEKWISVLVTSNMFVQFYRNTPVLIGTIIGLLALLILIILFIIKRRKKEEEEGQTAK